jgi:hypothetical protein
VLTPTNPSGVALTHTCNSENIVMSSIVRVFRSCWTGYTLVFFAGCGYGGGAQPADREQSRKALQTALDAWKAGEKPEALENLSPPIHVKDADWKGGFLLLEYKADQEGKLVGFDMDYPVVLELKDPKGKPVKKTAVYSISTRPGLRITRQEG